MLKQNNRFNKKPKQELDRCPVSSKMRNRALNPSIMHWTPASCPELSIMPWTQHRTFNPASCHLVINPASCPEPQHRALNPSIVPSTQHRALNPSILPWTQHSAPNPASCPEPQHRAINPASCSEPQHSALNPTLCPKPSIVPEPQHRALIPASYPWTPSIIPLNSVVSSRGSPSTWIQKRGKHEPSSPKPREKDDILQLASIKAKCTTETGCRFEAHGCLNSTCRILLVRSTEWRRHQGSSSSRKNQKNQCRS